nr:MAG TPA: hypothetical protein [Bacteriophage sp.]
MLATVKELHRTASGLTKICFNYAELFRAIATIFRQFSFRT